MKDVDTVGFQDAASLLGRKRELPGPHDLESSGCDFGLMSLDTQSVWEITLDACV